MRIDESTFRTWQTAVVLAACCAGWLVLDTASQAVELPDVKLGGTGFSTAKHQFQLAPSGLPEQIVIKPAAGEIPLGNRGRSVPDAVLAGLGRGPQLRLPIRLVAWRAGEEIEAKVRRPAKPKLDGGNVVCQSELAIGPIAARMSIRYEPDGAMLIGLGYAGKGEIDAFELVVDLIGPVDMAIPGPVVSDKVEARPAKRYRLPLRSDAVIWGNAKADSEEGGPTEPGLLEQLYVGSGDRGFTWLCDGDDNGWSIDPNGSMALLESDDAGRITCRMRLVNQTTRLSGSKGVRFALLLHPSADRPADARPQQWLAWPEGEAKSVSTALEGRRTAREEPSLLRADGAAVHGSFALGAVLEGPAGGAAASASADHADTYPLELFRYFACTHTGLPARVVPETFARPGGSPRPERIVLGRALLHDVGVDLAKLVDLASAARLVNALEEFGYFGEEVEFTPYWRSGAAVRFGEAAEADEAFATAEQRGQGGTYVSLFRRPVDGGRKAYRVMFVIVNERDEPVRERLYLFEPDRLMGGAIAATLGDVIRRYELDGIPHDSDWRQQNLLAAQSTKTTAFRDLEDQGAVTRAETAPGETYAVFGPIYVPAHDFRVLYASTDGK